MDVSRIEKVSFSISPSGPTVAELLVFARGAKKALGPAARIDVKRSGSWHYLHAYRIEVVDADHR